MTAAAGRLRVSQSAVSIAVAQLEAVLGTQLLIRRRSLGRALTDAGRAFLPEARDLLAHAEDVRDRASAVAGEVTGRLTVGCFRTAAPFLLPQLLESFGREHPAVELDFVEGPMPEIDQALREGHCELALTYDLDLAPGIEFEAIYPAVPYALLSPSHALAGEDRIALRGLVDEPMVLLDVPPSAAYLVSVFHAEGLDPRVRYRTSSYELVRSLVARGLGYALLISRPVGDMSYEGRPLVARPLAGRPRAIDVGLARLSGVRPTQRARAFAAHCLATLGPRAG
jgi:DNA-binding transcriptional LysR family regulator